MGESFEVSRVLAVSPERLFAAWLDAGEHTRFTGGKATGSSEVGGSFTAWDGYIEAKNLEIDPPRRVVQSWRTSEFPAEAPDSRLEVRFEPEGDGTRLVFNHSNIPEGQADSYKQGWTDHYFDPMERYFASPASKLRDTGTFIAQAADDAAQAVGEAVREASEQASEIASKVGPRMKNTAKKAAAAVRSLVKKAQKRLAKKPKAKAKAKAKAAPKRKPAAKAKPKKAARKSAKKRR